MEIKFSDYRTVAQLAEEWNISRRRVIRYCETERFPGALKAAGRWFIPIGTPKPPDRRVNNGRKPKKTEE